MYPDPTKAVPGGCLVGLFGVFSWVYTGLCFYILLNRESIEDPQEQAEMVQKFLTHAVISFFLGLGLLYAGYRLALRADMSDPGNPNKPILR